MPEWVRVASADELPPGQILGCAAGSERIVLVNVEGDFYALLDRCSHQDYPLSDGELEGNLPTGKKLAVDAARNLTKPRAYSELALDDVLCVQPVKDSTIEFGRMKQQPDGAELIVRGSKDFREVVVFTPPHKQAFCIEPYTCTTDAINLQPRGIDAGWRVLEPGREFRTWIDITARPVIA